MSPERALQASIVDAINLAPLGAWAVPNVVTVKQRGRLVETTGLGKGSPDVWVCIAPYGAQVWLEVKLPEVRGAGVRGNKSCITQRQTSTRKEQDDWHARAKRFGVEVYVVHSVAEALEVVRKARDASAQIRAKLLTIGEGLVAGVVKSILSPQPRAPAPSTSPFVPLVPTKPVSAQLSTMQLEARLGSTRPTASGGYPSTRLSPTASGDYHADDP